MQENNMELEIYKKEVDELKATVRKLENKIDIMAKAYKEQNLNLIEQGDITREILDANLYEMYHKIEDKRNYVTLMTSSMVSVVLLFATCYLYSADYDISYVYVCLAFLTMSTGIMIIGTIFLVMQMVRDLKKFIKTKGWKTFTKKKNK